MAHQEVEKNVRTTCRLGALPQDGDVVRATSVPCWMFLTQLQHTVEEMLPRCVAA